MTSFFLYYHDGRREIWKSDGSADGTVLLKTDVGHTAQNLVVVNKTLFFADGILWKSDGTPEGTVPVYATESSLKVISKLIDFNGVLFFFAERDGIKALWKSDGTDSGTVPVKVLSNHGSRSDTITVVGDELYFVLVNANKETELWKSDGTADGTILVKAVPNPNNLTEVNGTLYFTAGFNNIREIWKSDGTSQGTGSVTSLAPPPLWPPRDIFFESYVTSLLNVNDKLFFIYTFITYTSSDHSLNVLDTTTNTVTWLTNLKDTLVFSMAGTNGKLFFTSRNDNNNEELWVTDGTREGTVRVINLHLPETGLNPHALKPINGDVLFVAWDESHNKELWKSDGTSEGTVKLTNFNSPDLSIYNLGGTDKLLFFRVSSGSEETLWRSDGTVNGTFPIPLVRSSKVYLPVIER